MTQRTTHAGIASLNPYQPGKPIDELTRELGITDIVKLASNENPRGPGELVLEAMRREMTTLSRYPDGSGYALKAALAAHLGVEPASITLGNGSNDVLDLIARVVALPGANGIVAEHSFVVYRLALTCAGADIVTVPARAYGADLDEMLAAIDERTAVLFLANPNNPTGTWVDAAALTGFLDRVPERVWVVLDEAYFEYVDALDHPDGLKLLTRYPNLVVTRTFSKIHGLAALRVGYAVSSPEFADLLNRARQPFNVNSLGLAAAAAAIGDQAFVSESRSLNRTGLKQITESLDALGLMHIPSRGNFVTFVIQIPDHLAASRSSWLELTVSFVSEHRAHMYVMDRRRAKVLASALPRTSDGVRVLSLVTAVPGEGARLVVTLEGESQLLTGTFRIGPGGRAVTDGKAASVAAASVAAADIEETPRLWPWGGEHGIRLSGFASGNVVGQQRVEVAAWGPEAASVEYLVDGELVARTARPPFDATVDLGKTPLTRHLEVMLESRDGRLLARDAVTVNPPRGRLQLWVSDLALDRQTSTFRPQVTALPGADERPGPLEVSVGGQLLAVIDQHLGMPRLELPSLAESTTSLLTLRASTADGQSREVTRVLDSSVSLRDSVEVDLVELFFTPSSAKDDDRLRLGSLGTTDISVFENGKEQTLRSLESTHDLPLNAMIMVDVSRSLSDSFEFVKAGIAAFLDDVLRPADRAGIVAMSEQTEFLTPLTASHSRLRAGLQRLQPGRGTAIWDGVAATARYLADQGGKRAIVVVSDGKDLHSELSRKEAIAVAQDAGVTVHTIEIAFPEVSISGWPKQDDERRIAALGALNLSRLARTTGGLALRVRGEGDLERAYEAIETDLRRQYLAVYQSSTAGSGFRKIEVRSASGDLDFRAPDGYYP